MPGLLEMMIEIDEALASAEIAHAFGGALALMWCTGDPRTTIDIDLNVFTGADQIDATLDALPDGISVSEGDRAALRREGQRRLHYDDTPIDIFFNTTGFHDDLEIHSTVHELGGRSLPFLGCNDLAVFKAFFNRRKDWADIEEMLTTGNLDVAYVVGVLVTNLGADDVRVRELLTIRDEVAGADDEPRDPLDLEGS